MHGPQVAPEIGRPVGGIGQDRFDGALNPARACQRLRMLEPFDWHGVLHRQLFYEADPASELVSIQSEFDLVVLGTHGRTGIGRALVGSVASELLRRSNVPVLVTRVPA